MLLCSLEGIESSDLFLTHRGEGWNERWSRRCGLCGHTAGLTSVFLPQRLLLQIHEPGKIQTCSQGLWESPNNPRFDLFWVIALVGRAEMIYFKYTLSSIDGKQVECMIFFTVICTYWTIFCIFAKQKKSTLFVHTVKQLFWAYHYLKWKNWDVMNSLFCNC